MSTPRARAGRAAAGLVALALAAPVAAPAAPAAAAAPRSASAGPSGTIRWAPCADEELRTAGVECATIQVPLNWSRPSGKEITLAMVKRPATDGARRIGTMLLNNGGGGSAIEQLRLAISVGLPSFAGALSDRFDLVAVDPRGVGDSTPIRCAEPLKPPSVTYFPQTREEYRALVAHNRALAASCERRSGPVVRFADLESTARDVEAVRIGLGEARIDWYGIDYSTRLGRAAPTPSSSPAGCAR